MVYFDIDYTDPGNDAAGFGFVGVNGSGQREENYPFSSPSSGIIEPGSITYSFNQECGTTRQHASDVEVWVDDSAGTRSNSRVIHLACVT